MGDLIYCSIVVSASSHEALEILGIAFNINVRISGTVKYPQLNRAKYHINSAFEGLKGKWGLQPEVWEPVI